MGLAKVEESGSTIACRVPSLWLVLCFSLHSRGVWAWVLEWVCRCMWIIDVRCFS